MGKKKEKEFEKMEIESFTCGCDKCGNIHPCKILVYADKCNTQMKKLESEILFINGGVKDYEVFP